MESATKTQELDQFFAKETWTQDDSSQLYRILFATRDAADRFRARVAQLKRDDPQPTGASAVKLGIAQYMLGDFASAITTLGAGTDNRDRRWYQGQAHKQLGQYDQAIEAFGRALDRGWDEMEARIAVAECRALAGDLDGATADLDALAARKDGEDANHVSEYHVARGLILQAQGQHDQAEESYGEALDLDPHNTSAAFRLAFLYDMFGEDSQAVELYTQCLRTPPVSAHALINLAVLYEDASQWDQAERCLQTVLAVMPEHPRARLYLRDIQSSRTMYYDEDRERRVTQRNAVLDIPVTDFELSVRARNCLKKMDIRTLGDLLRITEADLLAYKNFGETSLTEIKTMLSQKGLQLGQDLEHTQIGSLTPVDEDEETAPVADTLLSKPVTELELSVRARKALQRLGIANLGDLAQRSEAELLACKNFGQTSLNEVKQRLAEHGLNLRGRK